MCRPQEPGRHAGWKHPIHHRPRRPACASGQASQLSANDVLKHLTVQRQVCDQLLQLTVLILKLLQPPHLSGQQSIELLLPIEIGCLADPSLAADVRRRHSVTALLQNKRLLGVRKLRDLHRSPLLPAMESVRKTLAKNDPVLWAQITRRVVQIPDDASGAQYNDGDPRGLFATGGVGVSWNFVPQWSVIS